MLWPRTYVVFIKYCDVFFKFCEFSASTISRSENDQPIGVTVHWDLLQEWVVLPHAEIGCSELGETIFIEHPVHQPNQLASFAPLCILIFFIQPIVLANPTHLYRKHQPVPDIDPDPLDDEVDQLVDLDVKVWAIVDDVYVRVVPPRVHGLAVAFPGQLQTLEPSESDMSNSSFVELLLF